MSGRLLKKRSSFSKQWSQLLFSISLLVCFFGAFGGSLAGPLETSRLGGSAVGRGEVWGLPGGSAIVRKDRLVAWRAQEPLAFGGRTTADRARRFVRHYAASFGVHPGELGKARVRRWAGGTRVRLGFQFQGIPVLGHAFSVLETRRGVVAAMGGHPPVEFVAPPQPRFSEDEVRESLELELGFSDVRCRVLDLAYWIRNGQAWLVWRADVYTRRPPQRVVYLVDAHSGEVLEAGTALVSAVGRVFDPSPQVGSLKVVEMEGLLSEDYLEGQAARVYQCGGGSAADGEGPYAFCTESYHEARADARGDFFFDPNEPDLHDAFAEVQAYHHVTRFLGWLEERFGFRPSCGGQRALNVYVNLDWPDAFYGDTDGDPDACGDVTLGQGAVDFAYDGEIIYHEVGHAMVDGTAQLGGPFLGMNGDAMGLDLMPTALNEGFADYFAASYTGDPDIGEYAAINGGQPYLRTLENGAACPEALTGEPHQDGLVLSGALWSLRQELGAHATDLLAYGALLSLPSDANFRDAHTALLASAQALVVEGILPPGSVEVVQAEMGPSRRGFLRCERIKEVDVSAETGEARIQGPATVPGFLDALSLPMQWKVIPEPRSQGAVLSLSSNLAADSDYTVYIQRGAPVTAAVAYPEPQVSAQAAVAGRPERIELGPTSAPAWESQGVYYVTVVYSSPRPVSFSLEVSSTGGSTSSQPHSLDAEPLGPARPPQGCTTVGGASLMAGDQGLLWSVVMVVGLTLLGWGWRRRRRGVKA